MVRADETRSKYITALRDADHGMISALIKFARN